MIRSWRAHWKGLSCRGGGRACLPKPAASDGSPKEWSDTLSLLRWVLIVLVVAIHTQLVADTGCTETFYGRAYHWTEHVLWLANPLFFLISGYLFMVTENGLTWRVCAGKWRRRLRTWLLPYLLWNTIFLLYYVFVSVVCPSALGVVPPVGDMRPLDFLKAYACIRGAGFNSAPIDEPLWFLRNLMLLALLAPLWYQLLRFRWLSLLLMAGLAALPHTYGFESDLLYFLAGAYLRVWVGGLTPLLRRPLWLPLAVYLLSCLWIGSPYALSAVGGQWLLACRNFSGMLLLARMSHRVVACRPSADWRAFAQPVFFVFALHSMVARPLTKLSAQWLLAHSAGSALFFLLHMLNLAVTIGCCLLLHRLLGKTLPAFRVWLGGAAATG